MDTPPPGSPPLGPGNASPVPGIAALEAGVASLAVNASAPATPPISDSDDSDSEQAPAALASLVAQSDEERADAGDSDARDGPVAGDAEVTDGPDSSEGEEDNAESEPENEKENENENEKDYEAEEITESAPASPLGPHKKKKCPHLKAGVKITKVKRLLHAKLKKGLACHTCTKEKHADEPSSLFVCLSCGQINCGRNARSHAVAHNANTSHPLSIAYSPSGMVWCYACDDEIDAAPGINQVVVEARAMIKEALQSMDKDKKQKGVVIRGSSSVAAAVAAVPKVEKAKNTLTAPGLRNLGNTCFFNATLQNLAYSAPLIEAMRPLVIADPADAPEAAEEQQPQDLAIHDGPLTTSLSRLLVSMNNKAHGIATPAPASPKSTVSRFGSKSSSQDDSADPRPFFTALSTKFRNYRSYEQQDSHEMLRRTVDQMREEQVAKIKEIRAARGEEKPGFVRTFVDDVFGGQLASIVVCDVCRNVSWVSEPFYDLSLSMANEKEEGKKLGTGGGLTSGYGLGPSIFRRLRLSSDSDEDSKKDEAEEEKKDAEPEATPEPPHPSSTDPAHLAHVEQLLRTVSISGSEATGKELSLEKCLEQFMVVEELEGSEQIRCEACWKHLHRDWEEKEKQAEADKATDEAQIDGAEPESSVEVNGGPVDLADGESSAAEDAAERDSQSTSEAEDLKMKNMIDSGVLDFPQQASVLPKKPAPPKKEEPAGPVKPGPVMRNAKKRYLLLHPLPPVLVLHLKRFQQVGWRATKISKFVSFPEYLDLGGLCVTKHELKVEGEEITGDSTKFRLIGVVVHGGSLSYGHYTAYVRVPARSEEDSGKDCETWMYASDTHVREATLQEVLAAEAYLVFYERL